MARWRDVKQGKIEQEAVQKTEDTPSPCDAPLANRFKAFITDMFMLLMPIMYLVFYVVMGSREEFAQDKMHGWLYIIIPNLFLVVGFWFYKMQTPGMKAYEIEIVDSTTGKKPMLLWLINRYLFTFFVILLPILWFVPFLNKKRKTLQDYLSGTCIKTKPNDSVL
jgi:uncharacterized RDD family membrane protein YckC